MVGVFAKDHEGEDCLQKHTLSLSWQSDTVCIVSCLFFCVCSFWACLAVVITVTTIITITSMTIKDSRISTESPTTIQTALTKSAIPMPFRTRSRLPCGVNILVDKKKGQSYPGLPPSLV